MVIKSLLTAAALIFIAPAQAGAAVCDAVWHDAARNREVPVRVRLPAGDGRVPVVLYSHGLGGDRNGGTRWAAAWAAGGIATLHIQHPGSDSTLWAGTKSIPEAMARMKTGMTTEQFLARIADVKFVLWAIPAHPKAGACDLTRLDTGRAGVAGHSFGAVTTQALAGQRFGSRSVFLEPGFRAAIAFSPSIPGQGTAAEAFGAVTMPFLSVTDTGDTVPGLSNQSAASRTEPYAAMPGGGKVLLVFNGGDHLVLGGHAMRRAPLPADAHIQTVTAEATTAFWRAELLGDARAKVWLAAKDGLAQRLVPGDRLAVK